MRAETGDGGRGQEGEDGGETPSQDGTGTAGGKADITSCRRRRRSNQAPYHPVWRTLMDGDVHVLAPLSLHIHLDYLRPPPSLLLQLRMRSAATATAATAATAQSEFDRVRSEWRRK